MEITTDIYLGDSKEQLKLLTDNSVDLVVTSPPYADQRKNTYGVFATTSTSSGFCLFPNNYYVSSNQQERLS